MLWIGIGIGAAIVIGIGFYVAIKFFGGVEHDVDHPGDNTA
jgi:hypothetical protein